MSSEYDAYFLGFHVPPTATNVLVPCPACDSKTSCNIINRNGLLLYHCWRLSCSISGAVRIPGAFSFEQQETKLPELTPYTADLQPLYKDVLLKLQTRFHLRPEISQSYVSASCAHYLLGIYRPDGTRRGWVRRQPWEGAELFPGHPVGSYHGPKSKIFKEKHEPMISWYPSHDPDARLISNTAILVEDQISAMRVAQDTVHTGVALLGTTLNEEKVSEIQKHARNVVIALDADATSTAFDLARKWGKAFDSCRIAILTKDPKDSIPEELREIFY